MRILWIDITTSKFLRMMPLIASLSVFSVLLQSTISGVDHPLQRLISRTLPSDHYLLCEERKELFFLKIHKTASSTVDNMLKRYALSRRLRYPVFTRYDTYPDQDMNSYLFNIKSYITSQQASSNDGPRKSFRRYPVPREQRIAENQCDIIDTHTVFNYSAVLELLPKRASFMVSIRHPFSHMRSLMHQFRKWKELQLPQNISDPCTEFLKDPAKYDRKFIPYQGSYKHKLSFTKNYQVFMFGYNATDANDDHEQFSKYLNFLKDTFDVVIISERYDESVVLLRRKMCWKMKDVMSLAINKAVKYDPNTTQYTEEHMDTHRRWSKYDYQMYDMFLNRHIQEVRLAGQDFLDELSVYREIMHSVSSFCNTLYLHLRSIRHRPMTEVKEFLNQTLDIPATRYNEAFSVNGTECVLMAFHTHRFKEFLAKVQYPEGCTLSKDIAQIPFKRYCVQRSEMVGYDFPVKACFWPYAVMFQNPWEL